MLISVVLPVYNGAQHLAEALDSILNQTHRDLQLLVVDDGSTDGSGDIARSTGDPRVTVLTQPNRGVSGAINLGLRHVDPRAGAVSMHAADDVSAPHRLAVLSEVMRTTGVDYVHSDMLLTDATGRPTAYWQGANLRPVHILPFFLRVGTPFNGVILYSRRIVEGYFFDENLSIGEDNVFLSIVTAGRTGAHVSEPLYFYRRHSGGVTSRADRASEVPWRRALLARHSLRSLVPEAWHAGCDEDGDAVALATIGSIWARHGEEQEALVWFTRAAEMPTGRVGRAHVGALLALAAGDSPRASEHLQGAGGSAIAHNLQGEELARAGDRISAARSFAEALRCYPDHFDATANLRALGAGLSLGQLDNTLRRFPG